MVEFPQSTVNRLDIVNIRFFLLSFRVRTPEETFEVKVVVVCKEFVQLLGSGGGKRGQELTPTAPNYDVFISYCHKNSDKAAYLLGLLQRYNADMNIFYDRHELKTGTVWTCQPARLF